MQTEGLFQTFENYLFSRRLMRVAQEGVGGSGAGPETITGMETEAEVQPGPRDPHAGTWKGGGGGCLSRWWGLVILSTLESWIRLSPLTRRFERALSHTHT